jgi:hypothetical protein
MEDEFHYSTDTEWDREEAWQLGAMYPNRAWIVTDRDAVHANPFYKGPPVAHPEFDGTQEEWEAALKYQAEQREREAVLEADRRARDAAYRAAHPAGDSWDNIEADEIPF